MARRWFAPACASRIRRSKRVCATSWPVGVRQVAAIVLSPQYSPLLMGGYGRTIDAARDAIGPDAPQVVLAEAWHLEPAFIRALADRIRDGARSAAGGGG